MKPITKQTVKSASKFATIGLLIGLLVGAFIAYGQSPTSTFTISSGVYPGAPSYTIWNEGTEYFAKDANGRLAYSGTNASQISIYAVNALANIGGTIQYAPNEFVFDTAVPIDYGNIKITGSGEGYGNSDAMSYGYGTRIIADGISAFVIGDLAIPPPLGDIRGVTIEHLAIYGHYSEGAVADTVYSSGSGIYIGAGSFLKFNDLFITRKQYGICFSTRGGYVTDWVTIENSQFQRNLWGIYHAAGWVAYVRINDIHGYLNQRSLVRMAPTYSFIGNGIDSEADSWNSPDQASEGPIYLSSYADIHLTNTYVDGAKGTTRTVAQALLKIELSTNGYVFIRDVYLQSGAYYGLYIGGSETNTRVDIDSFVIGPHGECGARGSNGTIGLNGIYIGVTKGWIGHGFINKTLEPAFSPIYRTFGTLEIDKVETTLGFYGHNEGNNTISDGGTINHGMAGTPTSIRVQTSISGEFASVTAKDSTTFTVAIKKHDGSAGTSQQIYWELYYGAN